MRKIINKSLLSLSVLVALVMSCESTSDTFSEFSSLGETIYVGSPDTVVTAHGYETIKFYVTINSDPKISKGVAIVGNVDSLMQEFEVVRQNDGVDIIDFDFDLPEGEYTFNIYLMDDLDNQSIAYEVSTKTYGANYEGALIPRRASSVTAIGDNSVRIIWLPADGIDGIVRTEITYMDVNEVSKMMEVENNSDTTEISYLAGSVMEVVGVFKPLGNSIHEFISNPTEVTLPD